MLEDLYLPYRPKRRTKASIAREKGLEPLADYLWNQEARDVPLRAYAEQFVNARNGVASVEEALEGARHIIAERISETAEFRGHLRQMMLSEGVVVSHAVEGAEDPGRQVQDVLRLPGTRRQDSLASHAGHSPRHEREHPVLPDRTRFSSRS